MSAHPVAGIVRTASLEHVLREPDGVLKATVIAAVMCGDGEIGVLGLDDLHREFVRLPMDPDVAAFIGAELTALAAIARRRAQQKEGGA